MWRLVTQPKAHTKNALFLWAQSIEHLVDFFLQVAGDDRIQWGSRFLILDQRPEFGITLADVILQRHSALGYLQGILDLVDM